MVANVWTFYWCPLAQRQQQDHKWSKKFGSKQRSDQNWTLSLPKRRKNERCGPNHRHRSASTATSAGAGGKPTPNERRPSDQRRLSSDQRQTGCSEDGKGLMWMLILAGMRVKVQRHSMPLSSLENRPASGYESVEILMWKFSKTIKGFLIKVPCPATDASGDADADSDAGFEREKVSLAETNLFASNVLPQMLTRLAGSRETSRCFWINYLVGESIYSCYLVSWLIANQMTSSLPASRPNISSPNGQKPSIVWL